MAEAEIWGWDEAGADQCPDVVRVREADGGNMA